MVGRLFGTAVLVFSLVNAPAVALAAAADSATPTPAPPAAEHPRDGGIIAGKITNVDLQHNIITVNKTLIIVMPSTQIQGNDPSYHAITDLRPGMPVEVYTSQIDGKYIAQIITLK